MMRVILSFFLVVGPLAEAFVGMARRVIGAAGAVRVIPEDLRRLREENDFLAIAEQAGLLDEKEVAKARETTAQDAPGKKEYDRAGSRVGGWLGDFVVGTPLSNERDREDDLIDRFARIVDERRENQDPREEENEEEK